MRSRHRRGGGLLADFAPTSTNAAVRGVVVAAGARRDGSLFLPVALREVELAEGLGDLEGLEGHSVVAVLARLRGVFVGVITGNVHRGRCAAEDLRRTASRALAGAVVAHLARDAAESPPSPCSDPVGELLRRAPESHRAPRADASGFSVAVCTRDRPDALDRCLRALAALDPPPREVLVIDNAPNSDDTLRLVRDGFPGMRYVREPSPGLDRARNRAIAEARGDVIAFTDDDVVVDAGWLGPLSSLFAQNPEVAAATGLVLPLELETEAQWLFEQYGGFARGFVRHWRSAPRAPWRPIAHRHGNTGKLGTGANMAFRRTFLSRLGGFDPALDVGTATSGGGDLEIFFRTLKIGGMVAYEPAAVVRHSHRRTYEELRTQIESWGTGMGAYLARSAAHFPDERLSIVLLRSWLLGSWFARRLAFSYVREPFPRELIVRELRGTARGASLYRAAQAAAMQAGDAVPPPSPLHRAETGGNGRHPLPGPGRVDMRALELGEPAAPLTDLPGVAAVRLRVTALGRALGEVTVGVHEGSIGATRLRDEVAHALSHSLLGATPSAARRRVTAWLAGGASRPR